MATETSSPKDMISETTELGLALQALFQSGINGAPSIMHIDTLLSKAPSMKLESMVGALKILSILGIIAVDDNGNIRTTSKYARFALGSLSEFLIRSLPLAKNADTDADEERYMTQFTNAMETIRRDKVGSSPLYSIEIVNVIIKGKQIRNFKEKDVYLHVYHPKWKSYHLIGLGKRVERTTEELAIKAMKKRLNLQPHQYTLEPSINPKTITYSGISGSHGATTKYTIDAKVVSLLSIDLNSHLKDLIETPNNGINETTFRWFTFDEIVKGVSDNFENIMPSTPILLQSIDLSLVKEAAKKVDHLQKKISITKELSNRVELRNAIIFGSISLTLGALAVFWKEFLTLLSVQNIVLENLSYIIGIIAGLVAIIGFRKST